MFVLLVDVALSLVVAVGEVVCGKYMMVTVSACVGRGNGNSIRNVKVKSRNELVLGRAFPSGIRAVLLSADTAWKRE